MNPSQILCFRRPRFTSFGVIYREGFALMQENKFNAFTLVQRLFSPFSNGGLIGMVFGLCVVVLMCEPLWAQTSLRKMMEKRSTPDRLTAQAIDKASNFSAQELRMIDGRSVMSGTLQNNLGRRSEFSPAQLRQVSGRSEFSASEMRLIQNRSEVDATLSKQVQRHSIPDTRLRQRERVIDALFFKAVQKQSEMSPEEKRQVSKASDDAAIHSELQRNSVAAASYSRLLSKRSTPESAIQRLLRARSVD